MVIADELKRERWDTCHGTTCTPDATTNQSVAGKITEQGELRFAEDGIGTIPTL